MKRFIFLLTTIFICTIARADNVNINWIVGDNTYATTQCEMGNDLILPTTPTKTGYTFRGWRIANYIPIEYLESTGTQYIDTGVYPNQDTSVKTAVKLNELILGLGWIFGTRNTTKTDAYGAIIGANINGVPLADAYRCDYVNVQTSKTTEDMINKIIVFDKNKNITSVYNENDLLIGKTTQQESVFNCSFSLLLFGFNDSGLPTSLSKISIYYLKIYDNDVLVRDFIPVIDGDGVPCMYDKVEGKFYYNQGTGDFIAGPVINE